MTAFAQAILFLSSYAPLLLVFALLDTFGRGTPSLLCALAAGFATVSLPTMLLLARATAANEVRIATALPRDGDVLAYIATYLVPFASVNAHHLRERLAIAIFVGLIAVLYVRAELFYVNPLLAAAGFRVFSVQTPAGTPVVLLCRRRFLAPGSTVDAHRLSDYVWMETRS